MLYTYHSFIPRRDRKKYIFPAKAFGYSFFLNAESKEMRKYGYSFRTDKKVIAKITDYLEGDIVYKLIKQ